MLVCSSLVGLGERGDLLIEWLDSHKVLPDTFNKGFERREKRAKGVLVEMMKEQGMGR